MLASATNFAFGFFGWPLDEKFLLSVTIENKGVSAPKLDIATSVLNFVVFMAV